MRCSCVIQPQMAMERQKLRIAQLLITCYEFRWNDSWNQSLRFTLIIYLIMRRVGILYSLAGLLLRVLRKWTVRAYSALRCWDSAWSLSFIVCETWSICCRYADDSPLSVDNVIPPSSSIPLPVDWLSELSSALCVGVHVWVSPYSFHVCISAFSLTGTKKSNCEIINSVWSCYTDW